MSHKKSKLEQEQDKNQTILALILYEIFTVENFTVEIFRIWI